MFFQALYNQFLILGYLSLNFDSKGYRQDLLPLNLAHKYPTLNYTDSQNENFFSSMNKFLMFWKVMTY